MPPVGGHRKGNPSFIPGHTWLWIEMLDPLPVEVRG